MDNIPKSKKIMTKDEVALLIDLIQSNPVLTSKETNATTNKTKEDTWTSLTTTFNSKNGYIARSKGQLKLKWDNLKKAARKRTQQIRINNLKADGEMDSIPPDDILEKVSSLLGSASTGLPVPFGSDGIGGNIELDGDIKLDNGDGSHAYEDVPDPNDERPILPDDVEVLINTPSKGKIFSMIFFRFC
ncbi:myb/SANT-like DNA-binding domain-containing protein 3 [Vanessa cardui]|uniref:myb/SANT-like DNA-binding domain-containing protein 3 n=1 Tax=Vanessa cardui TaxID=171605 RepID=UPI001F13D673|nr:myb/SANT-like DNA-binding domain-containing protein 3 [Vanessa cardui]